MLPYTAMTKRDNPPTWGDLADDEQRALLALSCYRAPVELLPALLEVLFPVAEAAGMLAAEPEGARWG